MKNERLQKLRSLMKEHGIDAYIIPSSDPHQSEYVASRWKSRAWLSGFTGSAGTVVVTHDKAGLWTDSRYFLQAAQELKESGIDLFKMGTPDVPSFVEWLDKELDYAATVGFDGAVLSHKQVEELRSSLSDQIRFEYQVDLIDSIWPDRPSIPTNSVIPLNEHYTGKARKIKIDQIRQHMQDQDTHVHIVSALDEIAWILNIRGNDVEFNPVVYSFLVISTERATLYIDPQKLDPNLKTSLESDGIDLRDYHEIYQDLSRLSEPVTVLIDPARSNQKLVDAIPETCRIKKQTDVVIGYKAVKNPTEIKGIKDAHRRDGVALVRWLMWLEKSVGKEPLNEVSIAEKLESFRQQGELYQGPSFNTIAGYGGNGAIVHYAAQPQTAADIKPEGLLLIDSGGQYMDGTTDITRTLALGSVTAEQKTHFTLVLKGHIDLAMATFPQGTGGSHLDVLARLPLWQHGLNYGHGTGHGVGHFLNVHEGPQQIRPENPTILEPGMLTSNEPGYYREGEYGIRIENLVLTVKDESIKEASFLGFETISLCPIDRTLIDKSLLSGKEIDWLNQYHKRVWDELSPLLDDNETEWLTEKTKPL
ncbi:M24 family metallopeptidase [candidate division KSB1 bacterium]|nr:M24 family metallopeptidase [candidate division KSB1 bacterium]